jgi:hypothetical protein
MPMIITTRYRREDFLIPRNFDLARSFLIKILES